MHLRNSTLWENGHLTVSYLKVKILYMTRTTHHVFSLQRKFAALLICVLTVSCTSLSWYLLEQHTSSGVQALQQQGLLLAENLSRTGRYSVFSQDHIRLNQIVESTLKAEDIVYVIFTDQHGKILASGTKGSLMDQGSFVRNPSSPLLPPSNLADTLLQSPSPQTTITPVRFSGTHQEVLQTNHGKAGTLSSNFFIQNSETVLNFAVPIFRKTLPKGSGSAPLSSGAKESPSDLERTPLLYGLVQIGLSDVHFQQDLRSVVWRVIVMTAGIIAVSILGSLVMVSRFTKALHTLTDTAGRIMNGDFSARLIPTTEDEIGELTSTFNRMTQVLQKRGLVMTHHLEQLKILSHSGPRIASPMEVSSVFSCVVEVLTAHLGFSRVLAGLYDVETNRHVHIYTRGFPENLSEALHIPELVISDDQFLVAGLLCQAHLSLHEHVHADTWQLDYPLLRSAHVFQVGSMSTHPIQGQPRILGFLAADKGPVQCEPFDQDLIRTLGNHLSIALDKIKAYQHLEILNQTLEARVRDRTDELETANSKLKDLDRLKSTFVSMASHELRTPLTSIKMFVDNMAQGVGGPLSQGHSEYLIRIQANVDRLQRMIAELLDITQIESGRMKLSFVTISVHDVVKEAVESLLPFSYEKEVALHIKASESLPRIEVDHDKLFQILTNLFHNAIKFSAPGSQVEVKVQAMDDEHLEVCVEDRGYGIAPKELDKIFQPFYRSSTAIAQTLGAGLGLSLCQHLVALHQGQLWVESQVGKGSRFHLVLPIKNVPLPHPLSQQVFR